MDFAAVLGMDITVKHSLKTTDVIGQASHTSCAKRFHVGCQIRKPNRKLYNTLATTPRQTRTISRLPRRTSTSGNNSSGGKEQISGSPCWAMPTLRANAVLVDYRIEAATVGAVGVLRISFMKTRQVVQGLWQFLEVSADLLTPAQVRLVVRRSLRRIANMAIPKRRQRSCPRALRQPVSSWPRLRKNTYRNGPVQYSVGQIYA
jgi:hypothetical protein